jgi:hypothetical protein
MRTKRFSTGLWLLLGLFALRVVAQPVQLWLHADWLPAFDTWHSGALPYGLLLFLQLVILVVQVRIAALVGAGRVTPSRRAARWWLGAGAIYLAAMLLRLGLGATVLASQHWFSAWLPTLFHVVLASFVLLVGAFHFAGVRAPRRRGAPYPSPAGGLPSLARTVRRSRPRRRAVSW